MSQKNKFAILLGVIFVGALIYYLFSTNRSNDLELIGVVDANQVMVSARIQGRIDKLLVDEGTPVKQGDVIAILDPQELQAEEKAADATIASMRSKVAEEQYTEQATKGWTSSDVHTAQARVQAAKSQLAQAEADLERISSDNDRTVALAKSGVASQQDRDRSEATLKAQQAAVRALRDQVAAAQADLNSTIAKTHTATAAAKTVASTRAQMANAAALAAQAQVRLGYTKRRQACSCRA